MTTLLLLSMQATREVNGTISYLWTSTVIDMSMRKKKECKMKHKIAAKTFVLIFLGGEGGVTGD